MYPQLSDVGRIQYAYLWTRTCSHEGAVLSEKYDLQQNLKYLQQRGLRGLPLYPSQGATVDLWQRSLERIR